MGARCFAKEDGWQSYIRDGAQFNLRRRGGWSVFEINNFEPIPYEINNLFQELL